MDPARSQLKGCSAAAHPAPEAVMTHGSASLTPRGHHGGDVDGQGAARWLAFLRADDAGGYRHLLVLRFVVVNLIAFALLGAAWANGWVERVLAADTTRLVTVIVLVFAAGLIDAAWKIAQTSSELDQLHDRARLRSARLRGHLAATRGCDASGRALVGSALRLRLSARIASVRHLANSLVFLGLIGTVVGFIIALSGVDASAAADVEAIGPMVSTLIGGMSVALYTTLVGSILNIWLMINYRLLEGGTVRLLATIVERGEADA